MLKSLHIENYAILDAVDIAFDKRVNIITGETGAGKSILLGALGLIMGNRADSAVLYEKDAKCVVEAEFQDYPSDINQLLTAADLDVEKALIIRREIIPSGRSRAFINDTPTTLEVLRRITDALIDINQQFQIYELKNKAFHGQLIDAMAGCQKLCSDYNKVFKVYFDEKKQLDELKNLSAAQLKEMEFIKFQLKEFNEMEIMEGEIEEKEKELQLVEKNEEFMNLIEETGFVISDAESSFISGVSDLLKKWQDFVAIHPTANELVDSLVIVQEQLQNVVDQSYSLRDSMDMDPASINELKKRLDALFSLQRKHAARSTEELLDIRQKLEDSLSQYGNRDETIADLEASINKNEVKLRKWAEQLTTKRKKVFSKLQKSVNAQLTSLAMSSAEIKVEHVLSDSLLKNGQDQIQILFKANKGGSFQPIGKVASGGESARLMLALKSTVANKMALPTMIFDEIDTGVSGEVALKMGKIIAGLGKAHQVITITHSPQVAARSTNHIHVHKEETKTRTITKVRTLNRDEKRLELAKMLSGDPPSTFALENAKELLES